MYRRSSDSASASRLSATELRSDSGSTSVADANRGAISQAVWGENGRSFRDVNTVAGMNA